MCGIAGFLGEGSEPVLIKMTESLKRRGPDDQGVLFKEGLGLGHRRLSVIDLTAAGHQPMTDVTGQASIVFNGEVYNFKTLKEDLIKQGFKFNNQTDTEVILNAYLAFGFEAFSKLEGMFALALYDHRSGEIILARDRLGKKPLYWSLTGETLLFGSELKALKLHPLFRSIINPDALAAYLMFDYVPGPASIWQGVNKLSPGHYLIYKSGISPITKSFWTPNHQTINLDLEEVKTQLDLKLETSVKNRLVADVPVGLFLSGGLDSSAVAYYGARLSNRPLKAFSIAFEEKTFDESDYARRLALGLGLDHEVFKLSAGDCLDLIPQVTSFLDEPLADASILPTYFLSLATKKRVTVALSGDGGDELFAGYPTFKAEQVAKWLFKLPLKLRRGLYQTALLLPANFDYFSFEFKLKKFLSGGDDNYSPSERHQRWLGNYSPRELGELLTADFLASTDLANLVGGLSAKYPAQSALDELTKLLVFYQRTYLADQVLVKVDRASMAAGLEVRSPLLDYELVDWANALPANFKLKGGQSKFILKELMRGKIPTEIIDRSKQGFALPMAKWLNCELKSLVDDKLSKERLSTQQIFKPTKVAELIASHRTGRRNNAKLLWNLLSFQLWYDEWFTA